MPAIIAGTWLLDSTGERASTESLLVFLPGEQAETVFKPDNRLLVDSSEFASGGKYRPIVKLQMRHEYQSVADNLWTNGTGWLIRSDLLVTAGHCVYDWDYGQGGLGRCIKVKAYIGYNGESSVGSPDVQFRQGRRVVTTDHWLKSKNNMPNDVAFIQLDQPFRNVRPYKLCTTPMTGNASLGVVGYPGDKELNGVIAEQMYEEFSNVKWNMAQSDRKMLEYQIDTFAGQSGSPVLRQSDFRVIGTHVVGGKSINFASVINGIYGNPYRSYISVFDRQYPTVQECRGITYVHVAYRPTASDALNDGSGSVEFWSDLKSAFNVAQPIVGDILDMKNSALGPVSSPITALVGAALGVARKLARQENDAPEQVPDNAHVYRAMLAEAALCVIEDTDEETVQNMKIVETMQSVHNGLATQARLLAPRLIPVLMEPSLRVTLDVCHRHQSGGESEFLFDGHPQELKFSTDSLEVPESDRFTHELLGQTIRETGDQGFWDILGDILSIAGQTIEPATQAGNLFEHLASETQDTQGEKILSDFTNRAVMGEAVLQALQKIDSNYLESEGFLTGLKSVVQEIGPTVMKLAPSVIESMGQIVRVREGD